MKHSAAYIVAFLTGAVISLMVVANTTLGAATSNEVSLIINQSIGVVLTTLILFIGRKNPVIAPKRQPSRWYMYFGGLFGVLVMIFNFYSVLNVGATLAMASAVFGQSLMGLLMDLFGLFGMEKRAIGRTKALSIALSFAGILIMSIGGEAYNLIYIAMGIAAGVLTMTQMCYNSTFAKKKGAIFSARQNALSGVLGTIAYAFILMPGGTIEGFGKLSSVPFIWIILGGTLAIFVVTSSNLIIPKIPAVYSSLLMSSGQILGSIVLDGIMYSIFSPQLLVGTLVMLAGIAVNFIAERQPSAKT